MEEIGFNCPNVEIIDKIKRLRSLVKPRLRKSATLEIRIQPQHVTFHIPGGEVKLYCSTKGWGSYTLSLEYFYMILTDYTGTVFAPTFKDGEMQAGGLFTKWLGFKIQNTHPENKPTLELPLNCSDVEILKLRNKMKSDQINITNAEVLIKKAELKLEKDIATAHKALSIYGVNLEDIKGIVGKYID